VKYWFFFLPEEMLTWKQFAFAMLCCVVVKSSWAFTTVPILMQSAWAFTTVPILCRQREKKRCHVAMQIGEQHAERRATHMKDPTRLGDKKNQNLEWAARASAAELEQLRSELWNSEIEADWENFYRTVKTEQSYFASEIEGEIPVDLQGSIFRNGPGRFDRGGKRYEHVLDGDGHILKFVLDGSSQRAHISNKYVRTAEFVAEEARDAVLFRSTFGTQPQIFKDNFLNLKLKNQANTNVHFCGGRLLALWEAGVPYRLNPWTLATEGPDTLDGCVSGPLGALTVTTGVAAFDKLLPVGRAFTAHPHYDSATRRTVGWSWAQNPLGNFLDITLVEWAGDASQPVCESTYRMEGCTMAPHDFAVTGAPAFLLLFCRFTTALLLLCFTAAHDLGFTGPITCFTGTKARFLTGQAALRYGDVTYRLMFVKSARGDTPTLATL
jgi:hypothetical protein